MVQVLDRPLSFGQALARGLSAGIGSGVSEGLQQRLALKQKQALFENLLGTKQQSPTAAQQLAPKQQANQDQQFIDLVQNIEATGVELNPKDLDMLWGEFQKQSMQPSQQAQKGFLSEDPFRRASALEAIGEHGMAQVEMERAKLDEKEKMEERKLEREMEALPKQEYVKKEYESLGKFLESVSSTEERLPVAELSIKMIEDAIEDPSKGASFADRFADLTGVEAFRSKRGAELQSAIKQYFLADLSSIKGGRINQLIEKQLLEAYPKIGRDPLANQKILLGMKMSEEIARKKVEITRDLEEKYLSEMGHLPAKFQSEVRAKLRPMASELQKDTFNKLDALTKFEKEYEKMAKKQLSPNEVLMLSPQGGFEAIDKKNVQEAKNSGYIKLK